MRVIDGIDFLLDRPTGSVLALYHCGQQTCAPGHAFGPAIRAHFLVHAVLKGRGQFTCQGHTYALGPGDAFLIWPGVSTYYAADGQDPWTYCWVGLDGEDAEEMLRACGFSREQPILPQPCPAFGEALRELAQAAGAGKGHYALLGLAYSAFGLIAREPGAQGEGPGYLARAMAYIRHNYPYEITVADVARQVGLSRSYLYKVFMAGRGVSPARYIADTRLEAAAGLLEQTDLTVTEVCYSVGYNLPAAFTKAFRKKYGVAPLGYRRAHGQKS